MSMKRELRVGGVLKKYIIVIVLFALIVFFSTQAPEFLTLDNMFNIGRQASMTGIASVGMMFVLLIGGIDLSIGSQVAFVNILCAHLIINVGVPIVPAVLVCLAAATATGFLMGTMVAVINIPSFIATLSFMNILKGAALTISSGLPIAGFPEGFNKLGQGYLGIVPIPVIIMVAVFIIGAFILNKSYLGRYFYAVGGNEEASRLSGINVRMVKQLVFSLSAFFAALSGIVALSRLNSGSPQTGSGFEFDVITAVVLGGVSISGGSGTMLGTVIGVLIMGVLSNGLIMLNTSEYMQMIIKGIVLAVAVGIDCVQRSKGNIKFSSTNNKDNTLPEAAAE